jgi:DNA primase
MSQDAAKRRILDQVDLSGLISEDITLSKRSGRFVGLCPFHQEKSPSFTIFDDHYYCFGCQARGDAIDFVRHQKGLGFIESLKYLAEKYQIAAPELEDRVKGDEERRKLSRLYKVLQAANQYFKAELGSNEGNYSISYLESRGFDRNTIDSFEFGYAPDRPTALVSHLLRQGFAIKDIIDASLGNTSSKTKRTYDFYQHRIMIPIRDHHGRVVGFGGRALGDDPAKYKNSRETAVFDKSRTLYGLDVARDFIRKSKRAIIVEGYMDALQLRNYEIREVVACLGTALTASHVRRLAPMCDKIYLVFDGDAAGTRASLKTVSIALEQPSIQFFVLRLPKEDDPDTFVKKNGKEAFEGLIEQATDLLQYAIELRLKQSHDMAIPEVISQDFIPWLRSVQDPIKRAFLLSRIAEISGIAKDTIEEQLHPRRQLPSTANEKQIAKTEPSNYEEIKKPANYDAPLGKFSEEFLAHLFYATPEQLDLSILEDLVARSAALEGVWIEFAGEMLETLKKGTSPHSMQTGAWESAASDRVITSIERMKRQQALYQSDSRMKALQRLARSIELDELKKTKQALTASLRNIGSDDVNDILRGIQTINQKIESLQKTN